MRPDVLEPSSPEDDSNFRRDVQIHMKGLVGDAVGNVSTELSSVVSFRSGDRPTTNKQSCVVYCIPKLFQPSSSVMCICAGRHGKGSE